MGAFKDGMIQHSEFLTNPAIIERAIYADPLIRRVRRQETPTPPDPQLSLPLEEIPRFRVFRSTAELTPTLQRCS